VMSSLHRVTSFLPLFCSCLPNSIPLLPSSYPGRLASRNSTILDYCSILSRPAEHFYNHSARTPWKTPSSTVKNACLLAPYLAIDVLLLSACVARVCLPTRCIAMGIHVTILLFLKMIKQVRKCMPKHSETFWCVRSQLFKHIE
jgi:hypothetical protein